MRCYSFLMIFFQERRSAGSSRCDSVTWPRGSTCASHLTAEWPWPLTAKIPGRSSGCIQSSRYASSHRDCMQSSLHRNFQEYTWEEYYCCMSRIIPYLMKLSIKQEKQSKKLLTCLSIHRIIIWPFTIPLLQFCTFHLLYNIMLSLLCFEPSQLWKFTVTPSPARIDGLQLKVN